MATITASLKSLDCGQSAQSGLERVNYFPRQLLTAEDMIAEQEYFRQKLRRHNRFLHGWGIVCGLEVTAAPSEDAAWRVKIGSGYALGPYGDEIYVAEAQYLDLSHCRPGAATDPCEPTVSHGSGGAAGDRLYVAVRYAECFASPVRAMPNGCGCDESDCEYSRIRDGFEICCLTQLPPSHKPPLICELITEGKLPPCPPCPDDPWIVLAQVDLPAASGAEVKDSMINNIIVRRQLYSTAMLQEQLIRCCCGERGRPQVVQADLSISKVATKEDSNIKYEITVTNNGPSPAQKVVVEDQLSGDFTISAITFTPPELWKETPQGGPFLAEIGELGIGESMTISFNVNIISTSGSLDVLNTATVTSDTPDPDTANNTATTTTNINSKIPEPR